MLNVTGLNHFYYVRGFTDMRCKHNRAEAKARKLNQQLKYAQKNKFNDSSLRPYISQIAN